MLSISRIAFCNFPFSFCLVFVWMTISFLNSLATKIHFVDVRDTHHNSSMPGKYREYSIATYVRYAMKSSSIGVGNGPKIPLANVLNRRYGNGNLLSKKYLPDIFTMNVRFPNSLRTEITLFK